MNRELMEQLSELVEQQSETEKGQKNLNLAARTAAQMEALRALHGTYTEVAAVAIDLLYRTEITEQIDRLAALEQIEARARDIVAAASPNPNTRVRVQFSHAPTQSMSEMPEWTNITFVDDPLRIVTECANRDIRVFGWGDDYIILRTEDLHEMSI